MEAPYPSVIFESDSKGMIAQTAQAPTFSIPKIMLTPCIATILCMVPMAVIAALAGPSSADLYAILGMAPATVIVMLYALKNERTYGHAVSVFCGAGAVGCFGPGAFAYWAFNAETLIALPWQVWMCMGFIFAMAGWFLTYAFMRFMAANSDWLMKKFFNRVMEPKPDDISERNR